MSSWPRLPASVGAVDELIASPNTMYGPYQVCLLRQSVRNAER